MELHREDIIGKRIIQIYHGPWDLDPDGTGYLSTFIELEGGSIFTLQSLITNEIEPIVSIDKSVVHMSPTEDESLRSCIGTFVVALLAPLDWSNLAVKTSNDMVISNTTFVQNGAWCMGPFASPLEVADLPDDTVTYWERNW